MPSGVYQRPPRQDRKSTVRTLALDEPTPAGTPRRYANRSGYIRLRWKVGPFEYVERLEHRHVVPAADGLHVHHLNHNPSDNRPENLIVLTPSEHGGRHGRERYGFDRDTAAAMYRAGDSTVVIAAFFGVNPATVYRGLQRAGVALRSRDEAATAQRSHVDLTRMVELHRSGMRVPAVARALGASPHVIRARLRELGEPRWRAGRPSKVSA